MAKVLKFNYGVALARSVYKNRNDHRRDFELLRHGRAGVPLTRDEKIGVMMTMAVRTGKDTLPLWLPGMGLWAVKKLATRRKKSPEVDSA